MFVLETLGNGWAIDTKGKLQEKPCKPMRFVSGVAAQQWAKNSGIRTPLIPVDERETDGY